MSAVEYPTILDAVEGCPSDLIEVLQDIQTECNYLPEDALRAVSEELSLALIEVFRAANFFKAFTLVPREGILSRSARGQPVMSVARRGCSMQSQDCWKFLCAQCASQLSMSMSIEDTCSWCKLGEGLQCSSRSQ